MLKSVSEAWTKTIGLIWGDQTLAESSLLKRTEQAEAAYRTAAARLQEANEREDDKAIEVALRDLNAHRSELNRLRREAAAKRP